LSIYSLESAQKLSDNEISKIIIDLANSNELFFEIKNRETLFSKDSAQNDVFKKNLKSTKNIGIYGKYINDTYKNTCLIYFGGWGEGFDGIFKINSFPGNIIYFRDARDEWFAYLEDLIKKFIDNLIEKWNINKMILLGQSMGGYAALLFSIYYNKSIVIAINPQTFKDSNYNVLSKDNSKRMVPNHINLKDIRNVINKNQQSKKYIILSKSECVYQMDPLWGDLFYSGNLIGMPNMYWLIFPQHVHALFHKISAGDLYKILLDNYDILYNNMKDGGDILLQQLKFK
jgi:hypothetical protein